MIKTTLIRNYAEFLQEADRLKAESPPADLQRQLRNPGVFPCMLVYISYETSDCGYTGDVFEYEYIFPTDFSEKEAT